ncbi:YlzJ-like family protein [Guptibacillus hwajinpoensis]|uniref:YlzJ-like family protein n=1 Tax=Guptibacillus hwajinpoensis TaxID=208199 RepID=UPI001CFDEFCD|nr:YlzJ-like family protein [Pseudalkalibacillus hwajinpoensis]WLR59777.1 YlzJ-like family protein [Pseudalkalibacillus hwajinpoensis]
MILYTILPNEAVFPPDQSVYEQQKIIEWNGVQLLVERTSLTECRIVQVLSTDPMDYLNDATQPGQMLTLSTSPLK